MSSAPRFRWRTAGFALGLGIIAFALISAVVAIAQGLRIFEPACVSSTFQLARVLPWAFVGLVPLLTYAAVRAFAARYKSAPLATGEGPYRQALIDQSQIHAPRIHHLVRVCFVLLALGIGYAQSREWTALVVPSNCRPQMKRILMMPLGAIDRMKVDRLAKHFGQCYALPVVVSPPIDVPPTALDTTRGQWSAQKLLRVLPACRQNDPLCESQLIISVTDLDLYTEDESWNFALGVRDPARSVAVVSTYRMTSTLFFGEEERLTKMVAKDIALQYCAMPLTLDPHSVRYTVGAVPELDKIDESNW